MTRLFTACVLACAFAFAHAVEMTGRVVSIMDGDTIGVLVNGREQHVRLAEIDAPEKGQAFGERAKQSLSDLVYGKTVTVVPATTDKFGRMVAHVRVDNTDVNLEQVRRGMAWPYDQYVKDPKIRAAGEAAMHSNAGLWADARPVAPWLFRNGSRSESSGTAPAVKSTPVFKHAAPDPAPPAAASAGVSQEQRAAFLSTVQGTSTYGSNAGGGGLVGASAYSDGPVHRGSRGGTFTDTASGGKNYSSKAAVAARGGSASRK